MAALASEGCGMRIERRYLQWGVFLIAIGSVPLAVQLGPLDRSVLADVGRLWPILLITIGLGFAFGRSPLGLPFRLLPPIAFGLLIGAALAGGIGAIGCVAADQPGAALPARSGTFGAQAEVNVTVDCGSVAVATAPGSGWSFSGSGDPGRPPSIESSPGSLTVANGRVDFLDFGSARPDWQLTLPADPSLDLSLQMNAGDARLDLAGARLSALSLTANAGSVKVNLTGITAVESLDATVNAGDVLVALPAASMGGSITVNAGHLGLCLPAGVGLRIEAGGALSTNNLADQGLAQEGDTWTSPGLALNAPLVDLQVTANAGNIELNPDGGCQ
jgi:hypothetical protein